MLRYTVATKYSYKLKEWSFFRNFVGFYYDSNISLNWYKEYELLAIDNLFKLCFQLDSKTIFDGILVGNLKDTQKRHTLRAVNITKYKRFEKIKGMTVADGRP